MNYNVDEKGYYGDFGGAFIPEMLYPNVAELPVGQKCAHQIANTKTKTRLTHISSL